MTTINDYLGAKIKPRSTRERRIAQNR